MARAQWAGLALALAGFFLGMAAAPAPRLLILGDSLTEGYGVEPEEAFPALLDSMVRAKIPGAKVIGGGVSGATSASAVKRLQWYGRMKPTWVLLALGSNDGLRGVPIAETRRQVDSAIRFCQKQGYKVMLAGLKVPPNYGADYAKAFTGLYEALAAQYHLPYLPFLLEGVAGEPSMNIADGIHPNASGHRLIARNLYQFMASLPEFAEIGLK